MQRVWNEAVEAIGAVLAMLVAVMNTAIGGWAGWRDAVEEEDGLPDFVMRAMSRWERVL